jgi:spore germination cell wall hydrolase CwlJ-like protein
MKKFILLLLISTSVLADAESDCLAETIFHEARGTSKKSKQAVGLVVLNRKNKRQKPICKIVKEPGQFDYVRKKLKIDKKSRDWYDVLAFTNNFIQHVPKDFTDGSTLFHNVKVHPRWNRKKIKETFKLDGHIFYKETA